MATYHIKKEHVKEWVVKTASVTNPYKKYWSASVTIINDYAGKGDTIEKAYINLTDTIYSNPGIVAKLTDIESFIRIVKPL